MASNKGNKEAASPVVVDSDDFVPTTVWEKVSVAMANRPCLFFWIGLILSTGIGVWGMVAGEFEVTVEGDGWRSRGSLIANRHTQTALVNINEEALICAQGPVLSDSCKATWDDLINNVQPGLGAIFDDDSSDEEESRRRQLRLTESPVEASSFRRHLSRRRRRADEEELTTFLPAVGVLDGCDVSFYNDLLFDGSDRLWPVWKVSSAADSFLHSNILKELCDEEEKTQKVLSDKNLCATCTGGRCLPPYSVVLLSRTFIPGGMSLSCEELAEAWPDYETDATSALATCADAMNNGYEAGDPFPEVCPPFFNPSILDQPFGSSNLRIEYTSSVFATNASSDDLFEHADDYAQGSARIEGAYDTQNESFVEIAADEQVITDMSLALLSATVTVLAMVLHTKSPFLSVVGLVQIVLSFPLAFTAYTFVAGLDFFPFLNFIGVFVIFALGADDVFVAVDKFKNARLAHPDDSVQKIAAIAFPDAANAMLLTTTTTAVAFFGTAVCPVAPIRCFAVFVGLLVVFDYIMCVVLVFPALVIYDNTQKSNCCCDIACCFKCFSKQSDREKKPFYNIDTNANLIRRLLTGYYNVLHKFRWPVLAICAVATGLFAYYAARLKPPTSSDVRLFSEDDNQYEQNFEWRKNILSEVIERQGGSVCTVAWGLTPADTGNRNDPQESSQVVLDESFDPSSEEAQTFLRDFCSMFYEEDFASPVSDTYACPINRFETWLQQQSLLFFANTTDGTGLDYEAYKYCGGATGLPMSSDNFGPCALAWANSTASTGIYGRNGRVEIMTAEFNSRVRFDSEFKVLNEEWNLIEDHIENLKKPQGVENLFFSSIDFWWYDTNSQMLKSAIASAGIALLAAALAILFSSRSILLTLFSTIAVAYVLCSVTATLVGLGWTIGFLEAVLFAIVIGISCDFVIHFSHAYAHLPGNASRSDRTKFSLLTMGPSILAAAFTTFAAALLMLFTVIIFFRKFAIILFMTILQATLGSFVVFLAITECVGPAEPTYVFDRVCGNKGDGEADVALPLAAEDEQADKKVVVVAEQDSSEAFA